VARRSWTRLLRGDSQLSRPGATRGCSAGSSWSGPLITAAGVTGSSPTRLRSSDRYRTRSASSASNRPSLAPRRGTAGPISTGSPTASCAASPTGTVTRSMHSPDSAGASPSPQKQPCLCHRTALTRPRGISILACSMPGTQLGGLPTASETRSPARSRQALSYNAAHRTH
jgi:hypothetical protein